MLEHVGPSDEFGVCGEDGTSGMASVLDLVHRQHGLASRREFRSVVLEFAPVAEVSGACLEIFAGVDRNDERQRRIARDAWMLKSIVLHTLLAFDDARLELPALAAAMRVAAEHVPSIEAAALALARLIEGLVSIPMNPKREWFLKLTESAGAPRPSTAVLAALQGARSPGWPAGLSPEIDLRGDSISIIRARKDLRDRTFDRAVISGSTKFAARPLLYDLLYGGRARQIILLSYRHERTGLPEPIALPEDRVFHRVAPQAHRPPDDAEIGTPDAGLETWANESFWQEIRSSHGDVTGVSERDVTVAARFVLFADGSGAFLPDDGGVVEISELLERNAGPGLSEEQLPRKAVRALEEGDVVMLRLSGGGHYVEDVADDLMARKGLGNLRAEATAWKESLHRIIKRHGEGFVAMTGRQFGLQMRSAAYLWSWAGDAVIAPHDFETFHALIATLASLDPGISDLDPRSYATAKWQQMEHVKIFHFKAGAAIRIALLQRVRELVAKRRRVEAMEVLELQGVKAGRMGLLRVSAVDSRPMQVALSKLAQVIPVNGVGN